MAKQRTVKRTVGQALAQYLSVQFSERDGREQRLIPAIYGIFGHGNVAGLGQALDTFNDVLPFYKGCNEQAMVHIAAGRNLVGRGSGGGQQVVLHQEEPRRIRVRSQPYAEAVLLIFNAIRRQDRHRHWSSPGKGDRRQSRQAGWLRGSKRDGPGDAGSCCPESFWRWLTL